MKETTHKLYLVPSPLGDYEPGKVIPHPVLELLGSVGIYVVEELRTVRRYLSKAGLRGKINTLEFHELNEHTDAATVESYLELFRRGDVALISEAGLPAVADPGAQLVALCQRHGIQVVPFVGPSSLMLALMASGLNGQAFEFCGYLPAKPAERRTALKSIEKEVSATGKSHIFIETPYRNDAMLSDICAVCGDSTLVCVAADITTGDESIRTLPVLEWKRKVSGGFKIGKCPCVYIIGVAPGCGAAEKLVRPSQGVERHSGNSADRRRSEERHQGKTDGMRRKGTK